MRPNNRQARALFNNVDHHEGIYWRLLPLIVGDENVARRIQGHATRRNKLRRGRRTVVAELALPSGTLLARVTPDAVARLGLAPGARALALIKSSSIEVLGE